MSSPGGSSQPRAPKSRRVPEHLRKRNEISCDRCKVRKIRCVRPDGNDQPCAPCRDASLVCSSDAPRKATRRRYSSVAPDDARYALLVGLVRKTYPAAPLDSLEDLMRLAESQGLDASGLEGTPWPIVMINAMDQPELRRMITSKQVPNIPGEGGIFPIPEGRLLPAPRGGFHYVGPASSIYFSITIRQIVSKADLISLMATDADLLQRLTKAAEFTSFPVSQALEARIIGHPATTVTDNPDQTPESSAHVPSPQTAMRSSAFRNSLPGRALCDKLVRAFFDQVHSNFPIFHRGSFFIQYERIWTADPSSLAEWQSGWATVLMMVIVLGALALEGGDLPRSVAIQQQYLSIVVREGLPRICLTSSVPHVQALLLLALYQHNSGERNTAWNLCGLAVRLAISLGLHRDGENANFDPIERNVRRKVWWLLYLFEQNLSLALGRPASSDLIDLSAKVPDDDFTDGNDFPPEYFAHAIALTDLAIIVKRFVASISPSWDNQSILEAAASTAEPIQQQLVAWERSLPLHLLTTSYFATRKHRRAVLCLHAWYAHIKSVLGRPFLLCQVNHEIDSRTRDLPVLPPSVVALATWSVKSAKSALDLLRNLAHAGLLDGHVWIDLIYVHHAIQVLCVPYIARSPEDSSSSREHRAVVSEMISLTHKMLVAPTYRLLLRLVTQFAYAVGMGEEEPDSAALPTGNIQGEVTPSAPDLPPNFTLDQIFGPLPSRPGSPREPFADMFDFGLEYNDTTLPWNFTPFGS